MRSMTNKHFHCEAAERLNQIYFLSMHHLVEHIISNGPIYRAYSRYSKCPVAALTGCTPAGPFLGLQQSPAPACAVRADSSTPETVL